MTHFKDIPGLPGYTATSRGTIIGPKGILTPFLKRNYLYVSIGGKHYRIHRLVALAFLPNPLDKPHINHKDGDKFNNTIDNLEWCTASENSKHAHQIGLVNQQGENNANSKLTVNSVKNIRSTSIKPNVVLAKKYSVHPSTISAIKRGVTWASLS